MGKNASQYRWWSSQDHGGTWAHVEGAHRELEALPLCTDDILLRHHHVLKVDQPRVRAPLTHVDQLRVDRDPGRVAVDAALATREGQLPLSDRHGRRGHDGATGPGLHEAGH